MYVIQGDIILQISEFCFPFAQMQCISELCCNFQVPASNTVGEVAVREQ